MVRKFTFGTRKDQHYVQTKGAYANRSFGSYHCGVDGRNWRTGTNDGVKNKGKKTCHECCLPE